MGSLIFLSSRSFWFVAIAVAAWGTADLFHPDARAGLFLAAEFSGNEIHGDSFVVPISNPSDVAHARQLIEIGPAVGAPIFVAAMEAGADGINRDYRASGWPDWSWHITQFEGFADVIIELYDGWPGFIEADVDGWIDNTGGHIGFWSYTIVAELRPADFDADGDIDGDDFLVWQDGFGISDGARRENGDADGDSDVDGDDFLAWQEGFHQPGSGSTTPIPEPNALLLVLVSLTMVRAVTGIRSGPRRLG